ncbi:MAG: hypothetical protein B6I38_05890 [Anaerolineaceae bacterium 4572_5.1]|nr:MAG: hypothetical protein B6I38_05890 [Anaerolineaceae bacterium 4572_5.1]
MSNNLRPTYLLETLGLSHDPFAGPVAEQELHHSDKEPFFFDYFTNPQSFESNEALWKTLRARRNGFIFGPPGSGKTTLRYALEAEYRAVYDRTLVVTYELSQKINHPPAADKHWENLARELAIDFFIQAVERLNEMSAPTDAQLKALQGQMALVWPRLRRTIELLLNDDFSAKENGLAALWPRLNRPAVRYIHPTDKITSIIKACMPSKEASPPSLSGKALLEAGLAAAKIWGFEQIFVLVDGVDAHERQAERMRALIAPLLDNIANWQMSNLFFYFFLSSELQPLIPQSFCESLNNSLTHPLFYYIIKWDEDTLAQLLHQRFRAADSRISGFDALAAPEWDGRLEACLIAAAEHSPRCLLEIVSDLIDAHAQNAPKQLLISPADWQTMRQAWSHNSPPPACPPP